MNRQEIEALVLSVADRVLKGKRVEDSLIECKGEWPEPNKARQLAAHANSARGEEMVWIIGLDERTGALTSPDSPDLADWGSRMSSRFDDHVVPDMRDLIVQIDEQASVTALVFATDRAPYVVKVASGEGRVEREVPIRDGTRTRSAYRHELFRLLHPATIPPPVSLTHASVIGRSKLSEQSGGVYFHLTSHLYIEQRIDETLMLPEHLMRCRLKLIRVAGAVQAEEITVEPFHPYSQQVEEPKLGVHGRSDGITVAGGAVLELRAQSDVLEKSFEDYEDVQSVEVEIELGVAGSARPIVISEKLHNIKAGTPSGVDNFFRSWSLG